MVAPPKPSDGGAAGEEVVRDWSRRASGRMVRVITVGAGLVQQGLPDNDEQVNTAVEEILEAEIDSLDEIKRRHGASVAKRVAAAVKAKLSNKIKNLLAPNTPGQQEQEYDEGLPFLNDDDDTNDEPPRGAPADGAANAGLARQVHRAAALPATAAAGGAAVAAALPARGAAADAGRAAGGAGSAAAGLDRAGTVTGARAPVVAGATVDAGGGSGGSGGKGPRPLRSAPAAAAPGGRKKDTGTAKAPPAPSKRLRPTTQANETAYFSD